MANYNLEVLNDKEFEELCKDLLENEMGIQFQIFKRGKDKGIDLRYAESVENQIIVQAKHMMKSKYTDLKTSLKKERSSMEKLAVMPQKYILMTTLNLSVGQTDEIVTQMYPFVKNSQDVYSLDRIMNIIANYPKIEQKYYKLWLTSSSILSLILNNGVRGRSEFIKEKILRKAALYVPTVNFDAAVKKLNENHFLIISGEPGIGKTTISYLLICDLLASGYELLHVDDHLKDAEDILSTSPDVKQVIFFDDFFGANLSEIMNPRNSESKICGIIERIQTSKNKFLVMTTRTTILKQAQYRFEKFSRSGFSNISKYELEIKFYSKLDKAKILYNHMYHSGMMAKQYDVFFESQNYLKIINHRNYFPRLIEFITSVTQLKNIESDQTENFIFNSLDNPQEIWHFAYDQQLNDEEKFLLMTLFSLGGYNIISDELENAFEARYDYEVKNNGFVLRSNAYQHSLKKLLDGFIRSEKNITTGSLTFSFLNPSVGDFIIHFLKENFSEVKRILHAVVYFKQITGYFRADSSEGIKLTHGQLKKYYSHFEELVPTLMESQDDEMQARVTLLYIHLKYFHDFVTEKRLLEIVKATDLSFSENLKFNEIRYVMTKLDEYPQTLSYVRENWQRFFTGAINAALDSSDISTILGAFTYYDLIDDDWSKDEDFLYNLKWKVNHIYSPIDLDFSYKSDRICNSYYEGYPTQALEMVEEEILQDYSKFLDNCDLSQFFDKFYEDSDIDSKEVLDTLIDGYGSRDDDYYPTHNRAPNEHFIEDEDTAIDRLFER